MFLPFALLLAAQAAGSPSLSGEGEEAAMIANCNARMAEIPVIVTSKGLPKQTKVKICGKVGQTDADWVETLKDALTKVEANPRMPPALRNQIIAGLRLEIAKVQGETATAAAKTEIAPAPAPELVPAPALTPAPVLGSPVAAKPRSDRVEYSALPPLPTPKPAIVAGSAAAAAAPPPLPAPRLTFRCMSTNSLAGEGPCDQLERGMMLTVKADEDVPGGTSLRFLRRGDNRAEVDLQPLRRGQAQRFGLPASVCQGVAGSRVEIQVIRAAGKSPQVVDTRGPFELRC